MKKVFLVFVCLLTNMSLLGQNFELRRANNGIVKSAVSYSNVESNRMSASDFLKQYVALSADNKFVKHGERVDRSGRVHEFYQQYYRGLPVDGMGYNFHFQDGYLYFAHGNYINIDGLSEQPSITKEKAIRAYANFVGLDNSYGNAELMIKDFNSDKKNEPNPLLVYKVYLDCSSKYNKDFGWINASTGELLGTTPCVLSHSSVGTFQTRYNNIQNAITHFYNGQYHLDDSTRCATIITRPLEGELLDNNNIWLANEYNSSKNDMLLDIHWGLQVITDYLNDTYDVCGYGNGMTIKARKSSGIDNAYWHPILGLLEFGEGDYYYNPLASFDIVAHEFGHAITQYNIGWTNEGETHALNEGLSDIWAVILETRLCNSTYEHWKMGEQVMKNGYSCSRNIANPSDPSALIQIADFYEGDLYNSNTSDEHVQGGVFSYWFYILSQGITKTINGSTYTLQGVGLDTAEELIATAIFDGYLRNTTSFDDVRSQLTLVAETVLANSSLASSVEKAWYLVGVPFVTPINGADHICTMTSYIIESLPSYATINWRTSNAGIAIVNGQGTDSVTIQRTYYNGLFNLYADIYWDGYLVVTLEKNNIMSGLPALGLDVIPVNQADGTIQNGWNKYSTANGFYIEDFPDSSFSYLQAKLRDISGSIPIVVANYNFLQPSSTFVSIPYICTNRFYELSVRGVNDCGETSWQMVIIDLDNHGGIDLPLLVSYDASTDDFRIELPVSNEKMVECKAQLWCNSVQMRNCVFLAENGISYLSASGLKDGLYVIRIETGSRIYMGKILKKR